MFLKDRKYILLNVSQLVINCNKNELTFIYFKWSFPLAVGTRGSVLCTKARQPLRHDCHWRSLHSNLRNGFQLLADLSPKLYTDRPNARPLKCYRKYSIYGSMNLTDFKQPISFYYGFVKTNNVSKLILYFYSST